MLVSLLQTSQSQPLTHSSSRHVPSDMQRHQLSPPQMDRMGFTDPQRALLRNRLRPCPLALPRPLLPPTIPPPPQTRLPPQTRRHSPWLVPPPRLAEAPSAPRPRQYRRETQHRREQHDSTARHKDPRCASDGRAGTRFARMDVGSGNLAHGVEYVPAVLSLWIHVGFESI